jgi:carboxypeptidase Taq
VSSDLDALKERLGRLADLRSVSGLAHWDQQTKMPPAGALGRAEALATLQRFSHELFVDAETGRLLEGAEAETASADPSSDDACLTRLVRRQWDKAKRVPTELAAELARAASMGQEAWVLARENGDFATFAPHLQRNVDLAREYVAYHLGHDGYECAYDVLLDDYEPEMRTRTVAELFSELRGELVPLITEVTRVADRVDDRLLHGNFPVDQQRALVRDAVQMMGFTADAWRMDDTVHPFAIRVAHGDVRITTRWDESYFPMGLYGAMHECGHGLYEAGIPSSFERSPLGGGESLGMHESQSRLWENMVGRSRAFCGVLAPRVSRHFGLAEVDPEALFRAVNRVHGSYIRVESDEVTYALHIVMRFELEQQLVDGTLRIEDLPEAWNSRFEEFFGLKVSDDREGVLQDVHWSAGLIGYFPTYALGNLIAGQLWQRAHVELPDLEASIASGDLAPLRAWLGEKVHQHGSKFTTAELLERAVGDPISVQPFVGYLKNKLSQIYDLDLSDSSSRDGAASNRKDEQ